MLRCTGHPEFVLANHPMVGAIAQWDQAYMDSLNLEVQL
jgi:hypothetical protein